MKGVTREKTRKIGWTQIIRRKTKEIGIFLSAYRAIEDFRDRSDIVKVIRDEG